MTTDSMTPTAVRELATQEITVNTDTREILANARRDTELYGLDDYFIVDVDSHHVELDSWPEIMGHLQDPVLRDLADQMMKNWPQASHLALHNHVSGLTFQDVGGRVPHQAALAEHVTESDVPRDVTLVRRAMESMSIDVQVVFPQPMLELGLHPSPGIAHALIDAYNLWFTETILPNEPRMTTMLSLPFDDPDACLRTIDRYADHPQVIGFLVTSQRHSGVHQNQYMRVYAELQERGLPLGFHAGPSWSDSMTSTMNRFISVHSMSFVTCNMGHLTNWIVNGIPERFPDLKVIWIESGLAWVPFMMQRLDHEYLMRQSDAPLLKRLPSDYMRDMYYTSQPMEITDPELLRESFRAMDAEHTLMWSSDWPHWDFDLPGRLFRLPFLTDQARRNILGDTACSVFKLDPRAFSTKAAAGGASRTTAA